MRRRARSTGRCASAGVANSVHRNGPDAAGTAHQGVELLGALHGDLEATAVEPAGPDALGDSDHSSRPGGSGAGSQGPCADFGRSHLTTRQYGERLIHVAFTGIDLLESVNWTWGLSLIALTIAIHTMGVVMMAVAGSRIRLWLETRNLGFRDVILIVIGGVGAVGLLLAALHGIEAAIWAAAYVWLGALDSPQRRDPLFPQLDDHARRFGADAGTALADDGRAGGGQRHAAVRYQHGLHFRGDAAYWSMLSDPL